MKKTNQIVTPYELNDKTKLKVVNVPDENLYNIRLTLTHVLTGFKPLEFDSPSEIADFIAGIDYEEDQLPLLPSEAPSRKLIKIRASIEELFQTVINGGDTAESAMKKTDSLINEWIGHDDDNSYQFPQLWDTNQRKSWISSRNHLRRQLRSDYQ